MTLRFYLFWLFVVSLGACSLLVTPEKSPTQCKITDGKDPCPRGQSCIEGECKASEQCGGPEVCDDGVDNDCDHLVDEHDESIKDLSCDGKDDDCDGEIDEDAKMATESCNGKDDDCDGEIDEDESFDRDGDGFTICGKSGNFARGESDCEPDDKNSYPGQKEECDGLNNDCDGDTDEGATCPTDQLCRNGSCVLRSCAIAGSGKDCAPNERCVNGSCEKMDCTTECGPNQFCDMATNTCVDVPKHKNGESCTVDSDCASGLCIDSAAFSLSATGPRRVCGQTCCSDANCAAPGEGCFVSGTGARSCLPRTLALNVTAPSGATAAATCTANSDCSAGLVCSALDAYQGPTRVATTICRRPALLERNFVDPCSGPLDACNTRLCLPLIISSACTAPCRTTQDCMRLESYNDALRSYCQYVELNEYSAVAASYYAPICVARLKDDRTTPATCRTSNECPEGPCLGASTGRPGRCAPTCCDNAHCAALGANARCVPVARGTGRFEMRCILPQ